MVYTKVFPNQKARRHGLFHPYFENVVNEIMNTSLSELVNSDFTTSTPAANVKETNESFSIDLAVPGLTKKEINIKLEKDNLIVQSIRESKEDITYKRKEFDYDKFKRSFKLPDTIDRTKISASFKNGILSINLAKREEAIDKGPLDIKIG